MYIQVFNFLDSENLTYFTRKVKRGASMYILNTEQTAISNILFQRHELFCYRLGRKQNKDT